MLHSQLLLLSVLVGFCKISRITTTGQVSKVSQVSRIKTTGQVSKVVYLCVT